MSMVSLMPVLSYGAVHGTQDFVTAGTFNFTVPQGIYSIAINECGGGGGGIYQGNGSTDYAAGGGGGASSQGNLAVTPGEVLTVVVGAAGARVYLSGTSGGHYAGNATASSVTGSKGSLTAPGGSGGYSAATSGAGGAGGVAGTSSGTGITSAVLRAGNVGGTCAKGSGTPAAGGTPYSSFGGYGVGGSAASSTAGQYSNAGATGRVTLTW